MLEIKKINCDLCVVGGGISGIAAAVSAAREGISVVLMHERAVLGGNASSEIRMWICGAHGRDNRETGILEEIALENLYRNPTKSYAIWDTVLYDFVRREKNITLLLNCTCMDAVSVDVEGEYPHGRNMRIKSVKGYQMTTQTFYEVTASYFCDCSGDSILAPLTGAEFRIGREGSDEFGEDTTTETADSMTMGMSCLVYGRETNRSVKYTPPEWSAKLTAKDFENREPNIHNTTENFWYLELGGNRNTIADTEIIRDELIALSTGAWDYVKNVQEGKEKAENWDVDFIGFLPGKRESRRMCGEYMITQKDICSGRVFEDEVAFGGWPLDDHFPGGFYHKGVPNTNFSTPAPYSIPYRALYSKNVDNLFFAGRNISMTHMAMSSIRVMATCALLGEAVGKAAAIAAKRGCAPHDVYLYGIGELQKLLMDEDSFLPSKTREIGEACRGAALNASDALRNGQDRAHRIYDSTSETAAHHARLGEEITYSFDRSNVESVHIVFCSDLNRDTLEGSHCERTHSTRANIALDSPQMYMPKTLCRAFSLVGELDGKEELIMSVENNRKRAHHVKLDREFDKLTLIPTESWGEGDTVDVISFDFR